MRVFITVYGVDHDFYNTFRVSIFLKIDSLLCLVSCLVDVNHTLIGSKMEIKGFGMINEHITKIKS